MGLRGGGIAYLGQITTNTPPTNLDSFLEGVAGVVILGKQQHGRLLHRVVVVVTHLGLAVFKCPVSRPAIREEQIGVGIAGALQIGIEQLGREVWPGIAPTLQAQGLLRPDLGQGGHALLGVQIPQLCQPGRAVGNIFSALLGRDSQTGQRIACGGAEFISGKNVATALGNVVLGADSGDFDAGAAAQQYGQNCDGPSLV